MFVKNKYRLISFAVAFFATAAFVSCFDNIGFYEYRSVDINGWDRNDFTDYRIPAMPTSGYCTEIIGIRANSDYPFQTLDLIVSQNIISTAHKHRSTFKSDTITVRMYDDKGMMNGTGVNLHQFEIPYKTLRLENGDSLYLTIRHNMSRRAIKGISDVGVKVYLPSSPD